MGTRKNLAIYSGLYAIFYSFCLYKNLDGITFPFFVIGTLCYFMLCTKEFNLKWKKDSIFAMVAAVLIGVSQMLTANIYIQAINVLVVFTLLIFIVLHQFSYDANWSLPQYLLNIVSTFVGSFFSIFSPFSDYSKYRHSKKESDEIDNQEKPSFPWYIIPITIVAVLPLLLIVIFLLSSADSVFANLMSDIFDFLKPDTKWLKPLILTFFVFLYIYGQIVRLSSFPYSSEGIEIKKKNPLIAITAGIMFDLIYTIFSVIQIVYLFAGKGTLPKGYTYATYAREGFFQLLFVCLLNLILVLVGIYLFGESKPVKVVLTILSICTYVMTASSAFRMILYIRYYYFSFLRILVLWALFVIFLLLTGIIVQIWSVKFNLFKYSMVAICLCYMVLSFAKPDYFIAKWNLSNSNTKNSFFLSDSKYKDFDYLFLELSADAAPILLNEIELCKREEISITFVNGLKLYEPNVRNFNVSKYIAKRLAD